MSSSRNINLDFLRILGVLIIMIAHASPPEWIFQLRNFGTPLLIVASALTYSVIYASKKPIAKSFYQKRLVRLVFPAWAFISIFFLFYYLIFIINGSNYPFTLKEIIRTYLFYDGIGFVWIFKVYIILALITPISVRIMKLPISNAVYFMVLALFYVLYECALIFITPLLPSYLLGVANNIVFIVFPYSILYLYGMRLSRLSNAHLIQISTLFFVVFIGISIFKYIQTGAFVLTQEYKYPPTIYYLSYAMGCLNLMYLFCRNINSYKQPVESSIVWVSSNSLWIYLWHILAFYVWKFSGVEIQNEYFSFLAKSAALLSFGIVVTIFQTWVVLRYTDAESFYGKKIRLVLT